MTLRIETRRSGVLTIVRIDGQLRKAGVAELTRVCHAIDGPVCLDLVNVQSIDSEGVQALTTLEARGAALVGVSPYVDRLLKRTGGL